MKLLSIIIPMYNVDAYVEKCFDSIYTQGVSDELFEIVAVNDGSPDNSSQVVRSFQKTHDNIILIEKENGGVSSARNVGMERAQGKYVIFVDPDDTIFPGSMVQLVNIFNSSEDNIIIFRSFEGESEAYKWTHLFENGDIIDSDKLINSGYFRGSVCGGGYKLSFLREHNITFPLGIKNGEDTVFASIAQHYAQAVRFCDIKLYSIFAREGSASRVFSIQRVQNSIDSFNKIEKLVNATAPDSMLLQYLKYQLLSNVINDAIHTPGITYRKLHQMGLKKMSPIGHPQLKVKRFKIMAMNLSLQLFYYLVKLKG